MKVLSKASHGQRDAWEMSRRQVYLRVSDFVNSKYVNIYASDACSSKACQSVQCSNMKDSKLVNRIVGDEKLENLGSKTVSGSDSKSPCRKWHKKLTNVVMKMKKNYEKIQGGENRPLESSLSAVESKNQGNF